MRQMTFGIPTVAYHNRPPLARSSPGEDRQEVSARDHDGDQSENGDNRDP
jgi:hypothetical protein